MNDQIFYKQLVERYTSKTASDDELKVFFMLLGEGKLDEYLGEGFALNSRVSDHPGLSQPSGSKQLTKASKYAILRRIAVAASVAGIVALGVFLSISKKTSPVIPASVDRGLAVRSNDIPPGTNRATLVLADGSSIVLDSALAGPIGRQSNVNIVKVDSGLLSYRINSMAPGENALYNTIRVPRGGSYKIALSDGTMVWLNAASTMRFPASFNAGKRVVELEGEAYFEVAQHSSEPFIVQLKNDITIQVLGTSFNVHCYPEEPVATTLLRGSVRVNSVRRSAILQSGQTAVIKKDSVLHVISGADTGQAVAWKNGLFQFNRADLPTIFRQIERWYDVEAIFQGEPGKKEFVGKVPRNSNLSQVLRILELSKIHVKIVGSKLYVVSENEQQLHR